MPTRRRSTSSSSTSCRDEIETLVFEAIGAWTWLDAARDAVAGTVDRGGPCPDRARLLAPGDRETARPVRPPLSTPCSPTNSTGNAASRESPPRRALVMTVMCPACPTGYEGERDDDMRPLLYVVLTTLAGLVLEQLLHFGINRLGRRPAVGRPGGLAGAPADAAADQPRWAGPRAAPVRAAGAVVADRAAGARPLPLIGVAAWLLTSLLFGGGRYGSVPLSHRCAG